MKDMNSRTNLDEDYTSTRCQMKDMNNKIDLYEDFTSTRYQMKDMNIKHIYIKISHQQDVR